MSRFVFIRTLRLRLAFVRDIFAVRALVSERQGLDPVEDTRRSQDICHQGRTTRRTQQLKG